VLVTEVILPYVSTAKTGTCVAEPYVLAETPLVSRSTVIAPLPIIGDPELVILPVVPLTVTDVTVPPPPGAVQVPSARRKFVVPPPDAGTTPTVDVVNVFAVRLIVPDDIIGELPTVIAAFAEDTPTDVTVPLPVPAPMAVLYVAASNVLIVLSALTLRKVIADGFASVNKFPPTVVAPRAVLAAGAVVAPVPPLAIASVPANVIDGVVVGLVVVSVNPVEPPDVLTDVTVPLPPAGVAHVPSPRQNVEEVAPEPEFKFATGKLPEYVVAKVPVPVPVIAPVKVIV